MASFKQAADHDEVRLAQQRVEVDLARTEIAQLDRIDVGIGGEELQIERAGHAQQLLADAARADHAERAAGEAHAHVVHALVPAARAREAILEEQAAREGEHERQRDGRDRSRHRAWRVRHDDAGARHRRDIDGVVADAMPGHDLDPAIGARYRGRGDTRQIDVERIVAGRVVGGDLRNHRREIFPVDLRRPVQDRERGGAERGLAPRVEDVARQADPESFRRRFGHWGLRAGALVARRTSSPWPRARCSIAWSMPYPISRKPLAA